MRQVGNFLFEDLRNKKIWPTKIFSSKWVWHQSLCNILLHKGAKSHPHKAFLYLHPIKSLCVLVKLWTMLEVFHLGIVDFIACCLPKICNSPSYVSGFKFKVYLVVNALSKQLKLAFTCFLAILFNICNLTYSLMKSPFVYFMKH
jgi:hypothetical protein